MERPRPAFRDAFAALAGSPTPAAAAIDADAPPSLPAGTGGDSGSGDVDGSGR